MTGKQMCWFSKNIQYFTLSKELFFQTSKSLSPSLLISFHLYDVTFSESRSEAYTRDGGDVFLPPPKGHSHQIDCKFYRWKKRCCYVAIYSPSINILLPYF